MAAPQFLRLETNLPGELPPGSHILPKETGFLLCKWEIQPTAQAVG
jgi:hypothetical protein